MVNENLPTSAFRPQATVGSRPKADLGKSHCPGQGTAYLYLTHLPGAAFSRGVCQNHGAVGIPKADSSGGCHPPQSRVQANACHFRQSDNYGIDFS